VRVWGRHHLTAALAAIAVGRLLGVTWSEIARGLADYQPLAQRGQVWHSGGVTTIGDWPGRDPAAVRAGYSLLNEINAGGRRVVVCHELFEDETVEADRPSEVGEEAITHAGADLVIACGRHAESIAAGAQAAGAAPKRTIACRTVEETLPLLRSQVRPGDAVLIVGRPSGALKQALGGTEDAPLKRAA
jgi:UDP-N-acetylmuramoyl-tripeptide--D-alanyl-D-alanine ligase